MNQTLRVNKTDFHVKGFELGLALKQRRKTTQKSPIACTILQRKLDSKYFYYIPNQWIVFFSRALTGYLSSGYPALSTGLQKQKWMRARVITFSAEFSRNKITLFVAGYSLVWYILKHLLFTSESVNSSEYSPRLFEAWEISIAIHLHFGE